MLTLKEREKKTYYKLQEDRMNRYQQMDEPKRQNTNGGY